MRSKRFLISLGVLVILVPFLGLPYLFLMWICPILGALIIVSALRVPSVPSTPIPVSHNEVELT